MSEPLPYVAIIDDSPSQLHCIEVILEKNCNVITFKHVDDFLSHEDLDTYDLIITDYIMPDKNGMFVLEACKNYKTPIIVMTGCDDLEVEKKCLLAGAIDFIRKPFSPETFRHRILLNLTFIEQKNQIIDAQEHLIANEKMAALGQLAAGVAHEVNNPMGYIKTNMNAFSKNLDKLASCFNDIEETLGYNDVDENEMLLKRLKEVYKIQFLLEDFKEIIDESDEGIKRVTDIVKDLKYYAYNQEDKFTSHDIVYVIKSALNLANSEIKHKANVILDTTESCYIDCIPNQLSQVLINLLVNACHAIENFGEIHITQTCTDTLCKIEVTDNGCGIDLDIQEQIFNPFFTTKPIGKGTGLGMAISKTIIEHHLGKITLSSKKGAGTTIKIELPLSH
ncbi:ATP-binding protein [Marinicellulosiphila megalodicopiae]|uniref:ATP-binding protein n=1 Tax=Marinicellulosiphila megalodicopiae TaxID=2724896 RepID=UPI003BB0308D